MNTKLELHQFAISHFCEKARWALDYKGLQYRVVNLLPGMHIKAVKKIAPRSSVPVLVHGDQIVQGSADIISYLDRAFPDKQLTPSEISEKQQVMQWESFADQKIGPHVRRVCYHLLLDHRKAVVPRLAEGGPWYGRIFLNGIFPRLRHRIVNLLKINNETVKESLTELDAAVNKINQHLHNRDFLVGDRFTRADLAVAALFGPLCKPERFDNPGHFIPPSFAEIRQQFCTKLPWVAKVYQAHR